MLPLIITIVLLMFSWEISQNRFVFINPPILILFWYFSGNIQTGTEFLHGV